MAFVTKRKNELENRVEELLTERETLNNTLDDTSDKIILLERHAREQDCQVHITIIIFVEILVIQNIMNSFIRTLHLSDYIDTWKS